MAHRGKAPSGGRPQEERPGRCALGGAGPARGGGVNERGPGRGLKGWEWGTKGRGGGRGGGAKGRQKAKRKRKAKEKKAEKKKETI